MRAAVSRAPVVGRSGDPFRLNIAVEDLRFKILSRPRAQLYILVVDTSGSMALNRIGQVKGAIAHLLRRSYLQRDHVTVISLRENRSEIVLPPSRSAQRAKAALDSMPVGGATPLALGLSKTLDLIKQLRGGMLDPRIFLFTDGHANVPLHQAAVPGRSEREQIVAEELDLLGLLFEKAAVPVTVIDTQNQHLKTDSANRLAVRLRAEYSTLPALTKQQ
jgi:magnesium chelatase subunit D